MPSLEDVASLQEISLALVGFVAYSASVGVAYQERQRAVEVVEVGPCQVAVAVDEPCLEAAVEELDHEPCLEEAVEEELDHEAVPYVVVALVADHVPLAVELGVQGFSWAAPLLALGAGLPKHDLAV